MKGISLKKGIIFLALLVFNQSLNSQTMRQQIVKKIYTSYEQKNITDSLKPFIADNFTYKTNIGSISRVTHGWERLTMDVQNALEIKVHFKLLAERNDTLVYETKFIFQHQGNPEINRLDQFVFNDKNQLTQFVSFSNDFNLEDILAPTLYEPIKVEELALIKTYYDFLNAHNFDAMKKLYHPDFKGMAIVDGFRAQRSVESLIKSYSLRTAFKNVTTQYEPLGSAYGKLYVMVTTYASAAGMDFEIKTLEKIKIKDDTIIELSLDLLDN